jgi:hypothetical protein
MLIDCCKVLRSHDCESANGSETLLGGVTAPSLMTGDERDRRRLGFT